MGELSSKIDSFYAPFPYGAAGTVETTVDEIKSKVVSTIDTDHGVLACGTSTKDNKLNDHYPDKTIKHWVAIDGYHNNGEDIYIVDPAKSDVIRWLKELERYYSVTATKLHDFTRTRGIVW